ncbi:GNAT family N-acetyltransferase [Agromyces soli]|uniref:GNAT family N-acetyltransferase n=1 Tax=Agromyces soli TaxID=659012 RepID=A0ABY4AXJ6_9MICO|nr:GNAT family protein [Agromyces soli]UOE27898.1 GNAT family N-acetyltransferase [Agromyces soli]
MIAPIELDGGIELRAITQGDGAALAAAYERNRAHLAPWEPERTPEFFSATVQEREVGASLRRLAEGTAIPLVLVERGDDGERIVGRVNLSDLVRGVFLNAHLGYWIDAERQSRGLATAAVGGALHFARRAGLHRVQAGTLVHNAASQTVLERNGFTRIGLAPRYLRIAGEWQDHVLFQRLLED